MNDPSGAATARAQLETPKTINAPLFHSLIDSLAEDRRWVVLDLGAARPQTIALLSRFRCRLDIADLASAVDSVSLGDLSEALPPIRYSDPTDIALCWDLLNYLERGSLTTLMASIAARCRPGAFVHALIVYSDRLMQRLPGQFVPMDESRLLNLSAAKPTRIAPRYSPDDLRLCMPGYAVERVRLLANGMQEYLFRL